MAVVICWWRTVGECGFHLYISVILCSRFHLYINVMLCSKFHLYISVMLCYPQDFIFILVPCYAQDAPRVTSGRLVWRWLLEVITNVMYHAVMSI